MHTYADYACAIYLKHKGPGYCQRQNTLGFTEIHFLHFETKQYLQTRKNLPLVENRFVYVKHERNLLHTLNCTAYITVFKIDIWHLILHFRINKISWFNFRLWFATCFLLKSVSTSIFSIAWSILFLHNNGNRCIVLSNW